MLILLASLALAEPPTVAPVEVQESRSRMRGADIGRVLMTLGAGGVIYLGHREAELNPLGASAGILAVAGAGAAWAHRPAQKRTFAVDLHDFDRAALTVALRDEHPGARIEAMERLLFDHGQLEAPAQTVTDSDPIVRKETIRALEAWSTSDGGDFEATRVLLSVGLKHETLPRLQQRWALALGH